MAVLVLLPTVVGHLPRSRNSLPAATLLHRIQASAGTSYSGYAESVGTLALPVTSGVSNLADLLGSRTSMRVWWRSGANWRVDQIAPFGEVDTHRDAGSTVSWDYERNRVERVTDAQDAAVRIPVAGDLLPPELGRRLLSQAVEADVTRLAVRRVAGIDAPGLRLSTNAQSSIDHVDVYAAATTMFRTPPGAVESDGLSFDPLTAAQRFGFARVPDTLAGLAQFAASNPIDLRQVGGSNVQVVHRAKGTNILQRWISAIRQGY